MREREPELEAGWLKRAMASVEVDYYQMPEWLRSTDMGAPSVVADALVMLHAYETDNRPPSDVLARLQALRDSGKVTHDR